MLFGVYYTHRKVRRPNEASDVTHAGTQADAARSERGTKDSVRSIYAEDSQKNAR